GLLSGRGPCLGRDREHRHERGGATAGGDESANVTLAALGPVSLGAAMGNGPRGLLAGRDRVGLVPPPPRAGSRVPMGRGRPPRDLRHPSASLLRAGTVE